MEKLACDYWLDETLRDEEKKHFLESLQNLLVIERGTKMLHFYAGGHYKIASEGC